MNLYDFLSLGAQAAAILVGFLATLAIAAFAVWLLLILGVVLREAWDKWVAR